LMVMRSKVTSGATASNSIQRFRDYQRRGPLGEESKLPVCMRGERGWCPSLRRQTGCNPRSYGMHWLALPYPHVIQDPAVSSLELANGFFSTTGLGNCET
jgi:hypothetical protein